MATMKAAVLRAPHDLVVDEVPVPTDPGVGEVILKVEHTAICGTDLHPYEGRLDIEADVILGHEFLGTVIAVGPGVGLFSEGDRGVASCVVNCGFCRMCRKQQPGRCAGMRMYGMGLTFGGVDGGQAEYVVVPAADLTMRKLPERAAGGDEDFLFVGDIMTTGYEAVRANSVPGDTIAIVGAGPVGLCAAMAAAALGARQVVIIDRVADRLKQAESFGAIAVNIDESDPLDAVMDLTEWLGADLVIDAVGHPSALATACQLPRSGGVLAMPGVYTEESLEIPIGQLWLKGIRLQGGASNFTVYMDEVMDLIAAGKLTPSALISHRMPLSDATTAYRMFHAREATKVVLDPTR
jgi:2-desacetyl-2-hydroxyethyl bacteriochlorophyllide A dehydrogenase